MDAGKDRRCQTQIFVQSWRTRLRCGCANLAALALMFSPLICAAETTDAAEIRRRAEVTTRDRGCAVSRGLMSVVPEIGIRATAISRAEPFVLQFEGFQTATERSRLKESGVELLEYIGAGAYIARCDRDCSVVLARMPSLRSAIDLAPGMKMAGVFEEDPELSSRRHSQAPVEVLVRFFDGVPIADARAVLARAGVGLPRERFGFRNTVIVTASPEGLGRLSRSPEVAWIEPTLPPVGPSLKNAAERSRVEQVRRSESYLGADGSGSRVGVVDWFPDAVHTDLEGRVTDVGVRWGETGHGVEASGAIAGSGTLEPRAMGMAPAAQLYWTSWVPEPWPEFRRLHDEYGVTIINNSWNVKPGWWTKTQSWHGDLWAFGYYHEWAASADQLVRDTDLLVVFSAGNKREISFLGPHHHGDHHGNNDGIWHEDLHPGNPTYSSIAGTAIAKNVLTVGGTTKEDEVVYFSSWGPTEDGRIKPELVATGLDVFTTAADDGYEETGGTSISAPVVAGIAALLSDLARRAHDIDPGSSLLKGLLIHTARDVDAPGPDYRSGFGIVDAELAARVLESAQFEDSGSSSLRRVRRRLRPVSYGASGFGKSLSPVSSSSSDSHRALIIEDELDQGQLLSYRLPVPSDADELRATLIWHDPPGALLVNDLDLRLVAPRGHNLLPYVLDPDRPQAAAVRGVNRRDPVEHARLVDPDSGPWWVVIDAAAVAEGPQSFTLIVSAGEGNRPPPRRTEGDVVITDFFLTPDSSEIADPQPRAVFRDGDPLNLYAVFSVLENADYGDFFGSLTLTLGIEDDTGSTVAQFSAAGHSLGQVEWRRVLEFGFEVPSGLPTGSYTARLTLELHNGVRRSSAYPFTVE
jgi:hypothetical protein